MKLMKNIKMVSVSIVASAVLVGCGSDSSSMNDSAALATGYFIDAAVSDASYETSSGVLGKTGADGSFRYKEGDSVTFSLGDIELGKCLPATDGLVTPAYLVVGDSATPTTAQAAKISLMLQTLQSLDSDNNASNGISIKDDIINKLTRLQEKLSFKSMDEAKLMALDTEHDLGLDEDYDGHMDVNATQAQSHFEESMNSWESESHDMMDSNSMQENHKHGVMDTVDIQNLPKTENLSVDVKKTLAYMGNEERLAYDVYNALGVKYSDVPQFTNIAQRSEIKHIQAVQELIVRYEIDTAALNDVNYTSVNYQESSVAEMTPGVYGVSAVQDLYNSLMSIANTSKEYALKVGCMVEVTDINDLNSDIAMAEDANASDVVATFTMLRDGSYNHYWAFDRAMKNAGYADGCYVAGDALLSDKSALYPKNFH